jgi:putative SOS response-associated peptidase YedK
MCGRFVSARKRAELLEEFAVQRDAVPAERAADYADYNVAPTKRIYAVMDHKEERELRLLRWGLVPFWAKDVKGGSRLINARAETVAVKPAFRAAFAKRRCLIPADGYYEWQTEPDSKAKQPFYIYRTDGGILAFAGLYELWKNPEGLGGLARPRQRSEGPPADGHAPGRLVRVGRPGRAPGIDRGQLRQEQRILPDRGPGRLSDGWRR